MLEEGRAFWLILAFFALIVGGRAFFNSRPVPDGAETNAVVIRIGGNPSSYNHPASATIVAQTAQGMFGQATVPITLLRCRVGDSISARDLRGSLRIDPNSCARPQ